MEYSISVEVHHVALPCFKVAQNGQPLLLESVFYVSRGCSSQRMLRRGLSKEGNNFPVNSAWMDQDEKNLLWKFIPVFYTGG